MAKKTGRAVRPPAPFMLPQSTVGVPNNGSAATYKRWLSLIKPDFVYAVLELERSEARFLGFSTFFTGERTLNVTERETITAEALLGIGYLEDIEDVEAAFALGERIAQDRILDFEPDADNNEDEGIITIRIGDE